MARISKFTECFDFDSTQLGQRITFLDESSKTSLSSSSNSSLFDADHTDNMEKRRSVDPSTVDSTFTESNRHSVSFPAKVKHFLSTLGKKQSEKHTRHRFP
jgi:hypothetical protein